MPIKISFCIPTLNRGAFIGATLESIISQATESIEIVIVDGGSNDNTSEVVQQYEKIFPRLHYFRAGVSYAKATTVMPSGLGFDQDCNRAVELAQGEYCWLMTDDDLIMSGAIKRVLQEVDRNYALIIANTEIRTKDLSKLIAPKRPDIMQDLVYTEEEFDQFANKLVLSHLTYVGAVIIKKSLWMSANREKYYGTGFIHVGVIFDKTIQGNILVTSNPLIVIRYGNAMWADRSGRAFQIWMFTWPRLVWSFAHISDQAKRCIIPQEPWRSPKYLLWQRGIGSYTSQVYRVHLSALPATRLWKISAWLISRLPVKVLAWLLYYCGRLIRINAVALFDLKRKGQV
ncbi:MAG: glycosyltransferase family 2 protein [Dehalococcoidia bacterium]|jgi:glycosyltransferase involved in cell wall biosynthesis